ncbi:hypothetical protein [Azospirillum sp. TSO22-1]|uniref:hypothetical protein n=1 Tax=Azospirillum sp. TSO22-1 TaxID=716789 RepID=UPI000D617052|nr:hypothetical protein [Azospirillum sp. TSO22-1]PWC53906.1 hypothetical protein TSO221_09220 [Azospirillum sp. TSO22-1]
MLSPDMAFGSRDRLLPASVPFRFFAAALVFHLAGWLLLTLGDDSLAGSRGGPGTAMAALHLFTLGTLATTAMGASYQLLPMATIRPVGSVGWARASFWLMVPGVALMAAGLATLSHPLASVGGGMAAAALAVFAALMAGNLRGASQMPAVRASAWAALGCLAAMATLGLTLLADLRFGFLPDHRALTGVHLGLALFGFMGMLVAGFSTILIPMLTLGQAPPVRNGLATAAAAGVGLTLLVAGAFTEGRMLTVGAALAGLVAAALHLQAMEGVMRGRMRKRLGIPFMMIRAGWAMLPLSLIVALSLAAGLDRLNAPTVFVILAVGGWLMTFLFGVLQRIAPFLASVHVTVPGRRPPLVSSLAPEGPTKVHAALHLAAIALLVLGNLADVEWIARAGAVAGTGAAVAIIVFALQVRARALKALHADPPAPRSRTPGNVACST